MLRKIIDILIIVVLLVGAFFLYGKFSSTGDMMGRWTFSPKEAARPTYEEMKKEKESTGKEDIALYNLAREEENPELCKKISNPTEVSRCLDTLRSTIALKEKDIEQCDAMSQTGVVERCRDNVLIAQSETSTDKISCASVSDENLRAQCEEMIDTKNLALRTSSGTLDDVFCETLGGELRDTCKARISRADDTETYKKALVSKTLDDCDTIDNTTIRSQCRDTILSETAIREDNLELCGSISSPQRSEYCTSSLTMRRDTTRYQNIISLGDISACETLSATPLREKCHDTITISKVRSSQEKSLCETLYNTGMITLCQGLVR